VFLLVSFFLKGGGVRDIATQLVAKRFRVVGEYVSILPSPRNRHIGHAVIDKALVGMFRIHMDQNTVSRFSLAAVAGHGIAKIQVGMLPQIESNDAA
jgi:hypothetical protein